MELYKCIIDIILPFLKELFNEFFDNSDFTIFSSNVGLMNN